MRPYPAVPLSRSRRMSTRGGRAVAHRAPRISDTAEGGNGTVPPLCVPARSAVSPLPHRQRVPRVLHKELVDEIVIRAGIAQPGDERVDDGRVRAHRPTIRLAHVEPTGIL
jgi:hypothetical protein